jgi:hypothetical protein
MDILFRSATPSARSSLSHPHARPDGDSIGSQGAVAAASGALGKSVMVNRDRPPSASRPARRRGDRSGLSVEGDFDALSCWSVATSRGRAWPA